MSRNPKTGLWQKIKERFHTRAFRSGIFITLLIFGAVALCVGINLAVSALPEDLTKIDTTPTALYTISKETENLLASLSEDVTITCVVTSGYEDATIEEMLGRYQDLSPYITVQYVDPTLHPDFTAQYTSGDLSENSLIVESARRNTIVSYESIYTYELNYTTYLYDTYFDGEGLLTSAIDFVTSDTLPTAYYLTGHGELTLDDTMSGYVSRQNIALEPLSLLSVESVPDDCACLVIVSPSSDISEDDLSKILDYLEAGGRMLLYTDYIEEDMPNMTALLSYYGVQIQDGIVIEGDSGHHIQGYAHYLLPDAEEHEITQSVIDGGYYVLAPIAQGIVISDELRDTLTVQPLLTTSDDAFVKLVTDYTLDSFTYEEGDVAGPFTLGAAITEEHEDGSQTQIVFYTTSYLADSQIDSVVSGGNSALFISSLNWMCEGKQTVAVGAKSMSVDYLVLSARDVSFLSILFIGVLPLLILLTGGIVWYRRRKR